MNRRETSEILAIPGLISFWDFQEKAGQDRVAQGAFAARLTEGSAPIRREADGVFGPYAARLESGAWFRIPRSQIGPLHLHGSKAQVSVVAWIKCQRQDPEWCDFIAGLWDERRQRRQYGLFLGLGLRGVEPHRQVCGHISASGGPSPGLNFCDEAGSGAEPVAYGEWEMVAMTYDGLHIRVYRQGLLDLCRERNPYAYDLGMHDGGDDGSEFTVGAVSLPSHTTDPRMDQAKGMGCWYSGLIGGLAVFDRALEADELRGLAG